jgi:hypothetical protein
MDIGNRFTLFRAWMSGTSADSYKGFVGRSRLTVYLLLVIALLVGIPLTILGFGGPSTQVFNLLNGSRLALTLVLWLFYRFGRLPLFVALTVQLLLSQLDISAEMLYCALYPSEYHLMLIIGNVVLSAVILLVSIIAYMNALPYVLAAMSMLTYAVCIEITGNMPLQNFFPIFLICFLAVSLLGNRLIRNFQRMEKENMLMKGEELELLDMFRMNKEQFRAYVCLAKRKGSEHEKVGEILNFMSGEQRHILMERVSAWMVMQKAGSEKMEQAFPELSASELEICRLILGGKKLREICSLLGKSEGNITSQRTHIRRKLGLKPEENLKKVLQERMDCSKRPEEEVEEEAAEEKQLKP